MKTVNAKYLQHWNPAALVIVTVQSIFKVLVKTLAILWMVMTNAELAH